MHKSTSAAVADNDGGVSYSRVVSRLDVGRRVLVSARYAGLLKYVGKIVGKDGIFCGVELDDPIGKHNGTHRNVSYFECRPLHGIFAPTYKVELEDESNSVDKPTISPRARPNSLTRSAIPALATSKYSTRTSAGESTGMSTSTVSTGTNSSDKFYKYAMNGQDLMNWSLVSAGSSLDNSMFSSYEKSNLCDDLMINSNHTYIVTDSDCLMLSDIEINDTNLLRLDEDEDCNNNNTSLKGLAGAKQTDSIILERPTLDSRLLPVVESSSASEDENYQIDEEEAPTPMVEYNKKFPVATAPFPNQSAEHTRKNKANSPHATISPTTLASATTTADTNNNGLKAAEKNVDKLFDAINQNHYSEMAFVNEIIIENIPKNEKSVNDVTRESGSRTTRPTSASTPTSTTSKSSDSKASKASSKAKTNESIAAAAASAKSSKQKFDTPSKTKMSTKKEDESPKRERATKKPRVSIKEMMKQPASTVPRLPKPPSKSQLMMEKLNASIKAEKSKPKKEIKSKVIESFHSDTAKEKTETSDKSELALNETVEQQENMVIVPPKSSSFAGSASTKSNKSFSKVPNAKTPLSQLNGGRVGVTHNTSNINASAAVRRLNPCSVVQQNGVRSAASLKSKDLKISSTESVNRAPLKARQNQPPNYGLQTFSNANNAAFFKSSLGTSIPLPLSTAKNRFASTSNLQLCGYGKNTQKFSSTLASKLQRDNASQCTIQSADTATISKLTPTVPALTVDKKNLLNENAKKALRKQLTWNAKATEVLYIVSQWEIRQKDITERKHLQEIERIRAELSNKCNEKCEALSAKLSAIDEERLDLAERVTQTESAKANLEKCFANERTKLMQRLDEAESNYNILLAEKREFEAAMAKNDDEKIKKLSNDITSLNFVLDSKTEEVRKLRIENSRLQTLANELPAKDIEIQKLKNRLEDSKEQLKKQQNIEKDLIQQMEKCREEMKSSLYRSEITERENEILSYKMQQLKEFTSGNVQNQFNQENGGFAGEEDDGATRTIPPYSSWSRDLNSSTPLTSRTAGSNSRSRERLNSGNSGRPNSTSAIGTPLRHDCQTPPRRNFDNAGSGVMHRSMESTGISALSIYQSQGRSDRAQKDTPTKIYAPDVMIEVDDTMERSLYDAHKFDDKSLANDDDNCCLAKNNNNADNNSQSHSGDWRKASEVPRCVDFSAIEESFTAQNQV